MNHKFRTNVIYTQISKYISPPPISSTISPRQWSKSFLATSVHENAAPSRLESHARPDFGVGSTHYCLRPTRLPSSKTGPPRPPPCQMSMGVQVCCSHKGVSIHKMVRFLKCVILCKSRVFMVIMAPNPNFPPRLQFRPSDTNLLVFSDRTILFFAHHLIETSQHQTAYSSSHTDKYGYQYDG